MTHTLCFPLTTRRQTGFTLVEMLVAATIAIIIFFVGFITITGTIRARGESMSRVRATENARLFFQMLEKDLASGHPGKFGMIKGTAPIPGSNPATLVLNDDSPASDLIQFYTHNDLSVESPTPVSPDRSVFVRYYVNKIEHTLCREVREDTTQSVQMELNYAPNTTTRPDQHALFEEVHVLQVDYKYWDTTQKNMVTVKWNGTYFVDLSSGIQHVPTHILVQLILEDQFATERLKHDPTVTDPYSNLKYRAFSKTFPIPAGF